MTVLRSVFPRIRWTPLLFALALTFQHVAKAETFEIRQEVPSSEDADVTLPYREENLALSEPLGITETDLAEATAFSQEGRWSLSLSFTEEGAKKFATVTRAALNKKLAILIDGEVIMAAVVREEITGGLLVISDNFSKNEVQRLAEKLTPPNSE
ncbi:MAG: hypothetical protein AAGA96_06695 [Verrucomicrobiota bacterium]